uniref:TOM1-like protein 9 n=1 Tax=Erigeron canadensis TaxID=72917 RepID=UPI001CB9CDDC|nr:TOM1-like protein 9 [Erigeron canadensis]
MVNPMIEKATNEARVGPDWAMNISICDLCNQHPGQAKDVVLAIKKRIRSKNVTVQLLALTLLESIVMNCGDLVYKNIAKKDLLCDMVKIVKKKPDFQVKEKILDLIDTWQEAFGGVRAKYPQYYAAYSQLLHLGITFPKRAEKPPPIFTPLQTQPLMRNPENGNDADEPSKKAEFSPLRKNDSNESSKKSELSTLSANDAYEPSKKPEFSTLSLTEFQSPRRIIGELAELLNSVDLQRKEVKFSVRFVGGCLF